MTVSLQFGDSLLLLGEKVFTGRNLLLGVLKALFEGLQIHVGDPVHYRSNDTSFGLVPTSSFDAVELCYRPNARMVSISCSEL